MFTVPAVRNLLPFREAYVRKEVRQQTKIKKPIQLLPVEPIGSSALCTQASSLPHPTGLSQAPEQSSWCLATRRHLVHSSARRQSYQLQAAQDVPERLETGSDTLATKGTSAGTVTNRLHAKRQGRVLSDPSLCWFCSRLLVESQVSL